MLFGLILFLLVVVGAVLWVTVVGWPWENPPLPPPQPTPFVTSAVATSAHTVHLTIHKGPATAQVEVERWRPPPDPTYNFFTTLNEIDDTELLSDTLYRYRARYTNPQSPWSPPKEVTTLALVDALNIGELNLEEGGWQGHCLVQRFEPNVLLRSGGLVSITLRVPPLGLSIDRIYISAADLSPGVDAYDSVDYRAAIHEIVFKPALVVPPSPLVLTRTLILPAISYALDRTKPLLIAVDFSSTPESGLMYREVAPDQAVAYYKQHQPLQEGEEPEARKTNRDGYTRWPTDTTKGGIYLIERIEVG